MDLPLRDIAVTVAVFGSVPFILKRPWVGILMWCWLAFMNPHRQSWGFAYDFPFAQVVAIATLVSIVISREPKRMIWTREMAVLLIFVVWMFITTVFALNQAEAWGQWDKVWKIQLFTFLIVMLMQSPERVKWLIWVIVLSLAYYGVKGGIFTIMTGGQYRVLGPEGTFFAARGGMGLAVSMLIPLLRFLQLQSKRKWERYLFGIAMFLTVFGAIGTQGRGALLAIVAMGIFLLIKSRKRVVYGAAGLLTASLVFTFMPEQWHERIGTIETYEEDASAMGRINAWMFATNVAKEHPVVGGGFEVFRARYFKLWAPNPWDVHDAHSIYFEVLGEHGFVGLFLFLMLGIMTWRTANWIIKNARGRENIRWLADLASMIQVSLVGYATAGAFLGLAYFDLYYTMVAIIVICREMVRREVAEPSYGTSKTSKEIPHSA